MNTRVDKRPSADLDLMSPAAQKCPYPLYNWLRTNSPVYKDPNTEMFIVTSYTLVEEAIRNPAIYSSCVDLARMNVAGSGTIAANIIDEQGFGRVPVTSGIDDPAHAKKRALVQKFFTAGYINNLNPFIDKTVNELIDRFAARGECEFMTEFCVPLPCIVIAEIIGIPRDDIGHFKRWSDAMIAVAGVPMSAEEERVTAGHVIEAQHYFKAIIDQRRSSEGGDLISHLVAADYDGRKLTDAEIIAIVYDLLIGGNETTTSSIGSGMMLLLEHPEQMELVKQDSSNLRNFVDEAIRLETPIQGIYRMTTRDTVLGDVAIPCGALVNLRTAAANRDGGIFQSADQFDVTRRNAPLHFGFGTGVHRCLGLMLAKREMESAFNFLLQRLDGVGYATQFEGVEYIRSVFQRTPVGLPLVFATAKQ